MIGDVVGDPGLSICSEVLPRLRAEHKIDFVVINGENSAKEGRGLSDKSCEQMVEAGADVITTGNHVWRHEKFINYIKSANNIVRPINFPPGTFGKGYQIIKKNGISVAVVNAMGRVFFKELLECPFRAMDSILIYLKDKADIILLDFHAEATSEKEALSYYLDGKIHALVGTHTHVQTADNRILPKGSAYMSDLGYCGALNSCLGMSAPNIINQYLSQMPARFKVELDGPRVLSGAILKLELIDGKWVSKSLERVREILP
jgi:metallophosphoesterase (TIGR00282 family)